MRSHSSPYKKACCNIPRVERSTSHHQRQVPANAVSKRELSCTAPDKHETLTPTRDGSRVILHSEDKLETQAFCAAIGQGPRQVRRLLTRSRRQRQTSSQAMLLCNPDKYNSSFCLNCAANEDWFLLPLHQLLCRASKEGDDARAKDVHKNRAIVSGPQDYARAQRYCRDPRGRRRVNGVLAYCGTSPTAES